MHVRTTCTRLGTSLCRFGRRAQGWALRCARSDDVHHGGAPCCESPGRGPERRPVFGAGRRAIGTVPIGFPTRPGCEFLAASRVTPPPEGGSDGARAGPEGAVVRFGGAQEADRRVGDAIRRPTTGRRWGGWRGRAAPGRLPHPWARWFGSAKQHAPPLGRVVWRREVGRPTPGRSVRSPESWGPRASWGPWGPWGR